jgi:hypothetical protein
MVICELHVAKKNKYKHMKHIPVLFLLAISFSVNAQKNVAIETKDFIPSGVQVTITKGTNMVAGKFIEYTTHTGYLDLKNDTL